MKEKSGFNFWRFIPGTLVSALVIFILSRFINYQDLLDTFRIFNIIDISIIFLILILSLIARGLVWKSFLDKISLKDAFLIVSEGYLFNNLIPRSGEVARIIITDTISDNNAFQAAIAIFFERAIDLIIAAGLFLSTLTFALELEWLKNTAIMILLIFTFLVLALIAVSIYSVQIEKYLIERKNKISMWEEKIKPLAIKAIHSLGKTSRPKNLFQGIFWIICSWILWVSLLYYAILQIQPNALLWWAIFCEGVIALGIALPSAPANLGVYEGTLVFALSVLGIEKDTALSTAIIIHLVQIATTSGIGLIALFIHDFRISQIIKKIQAKLTRTKDVG